MNNKTPNEYFCLAPWTHTFISPQSERRLCCGSREDHSFIHQYIDSSSSTENKSNYGPVTLDEHWNSEKVRNVRLKMLKGEPPPECVICHKKELTLVPYKEYFTTELFPHLIEEAILSTDENGRTTMKPRSFDYRFSNKCNFKCRMCGDLLSSSWELEKRKHGTWNEKSHPWMTYEVDKEIKKFQKETVEKEFLDAILRGEVEEIYWVGGEPLLWDLHWQVMQFLVDSDMAKNVFIRYNTNLANIKWKGRDLFSNYLPHFKGFLVAASIDGTGKIGEYIRTGLNWERWVENLDHGLRYITKDKKQEITLDLTITLPGLFSLKELFDFALERDITIEPKIVYAFDSSVAISPLALPRKILDDVLNDLIRYIFPRITPKNTKILKSLYELKKRATHEEAYPHDWKEKFLSGKAHLKYLESIREDQFLMSDILASHSEALNWWTNNEL